MADGASSEDLLGLREAVRTLTVRGRAFVTSGATAALCGLFLLERDLFRAGLVVALLPLIAAGVLALRRSRLVVERAVAPPELSVGSAGTVTLTLVNQGVAAGMLQVQERLPAALGARPQFDVPGLAKGGAVELEYVVRPELRGRYRLGPLETHTREPFGLAELHRQVTGRRDVLVLPRVVDLPSIRMRGDDYTSGDERPRAYAAGTVADAVVRAYRRGDDLRRVHWRSTARVGELMVRSEEQLWQPRALVLLDDRVVSHRGAGVGASIEAAVTTAASVVAHLAEHGFQVRLAHSSGLVDTDPLTGETHEVLEQLALLRAAQTTSLPNVAITDDLAGCVVVGIAGLPTDPTTTTRDQEWWARFPAAAGMALALTLDPDSWRARPTDPATVPSRWLTLQGWRVASVGAGDSVADAWAGLDWAGVSAPAPGAPR